jgi:hypothetical protein
LLFAGSRLALMGLRAALRRQLLAVLIEVQVSALWRG